MSGMGITYGRDEFLKIPTMVVVRTSLSKAGRKYFPFERGGCDYLKAYLKKRISNGEALTPDSRIIAVKPGFEMKGKSPINREQVHITTNVLRGDKRGHEYAGKRWRNRLSNGFLATLGAIPPQHYRNVREAK